MLLWPTESLQLLCCLTVSALASFPVRWMWAWFKYLPLLMVNLGIFKCQFLMGMVCYMRMFICTWLFLLSVGNSKSSLLQLQIKTWRHSSWICPRLTPDHVADYVASFKKLYLFCSTYITDFKAWKMDVSYQIASWEFLRTLTVIIREPHIFYHRCPWLFNRESNQALVVFQLPVT